MDLTWFNPFRWVVEFVAYVRRERKRKALFKSVVVEHGGEKIRLTWDGPIDSMELLAAPRTLTAGLLQAIEQKFAGEYSSGEVKPLLDFEDVQKSVMLFETSDDYKWKRKLRGQPGGDAKYVLKVYLK